MRIALAILLVIGSGFSDLDKIAKANKLKKEAREAYQNGDYATAITNYQYLLDSMQIDDDKIRLNLANAYYQSQDTTNAQSSYSNLTTSNNKLVNSTAHQQLGVMQNSQKKYKEALQSFKNALKADPTNEDARYNYEMLKKLIKEQEEQEKQNKENKDEQNQDQNKDQEKQDQQKQDQEKQDQEQKDQEQENKEKSEEQDDQEKKEEQGEEGEEKENEPKEGEKKEDEEKEGEQKDMPQQSENMKEMKISEEKAKMILEAMKNNEIQYFQQNKRKPTKRKETGKPDW